MPKSDKKPQPAQSSTIPSAPEPTRPVSLNWSYPFAANSGNAADPQTWLKALSNAEGGFYPLGANGMWHGGIHFDKATGSALKQLDGVRAIADGEVIAYRLDTTYPELRYSDRKMALYSTGFVLLRHRLILPLEPKNQPRPSAQADAPAADDVLEFYSLYMHQLDWAGYQASEQGAGDKAGASEAAAPVPLHRMPYWKGDRRFIVGAKATAMQQVPPSSRVAYRFDQPSNQFDAATMAVSGDALSDGLGGVVELGTSTVDETVPYLERVRISAPPVDPAEPSASKPLQGAQIRTRADGEVIGLLPRGGEIAVAGEVTSGWAQIAGVAKGSPVAPKVGGQADPRASTGWVRLDEFDVQTEPKPLDTVVVLDKPCAVKAGDVVGYLGEYQDHGDAQLLPPKPSRSVLHVEVFAGDAFKRFVERSRDRVKALPKTPGSLLLIREGARLVTPVNADLMVPAGQLLKLAKGDPGKGNWAKVQPMFPPAAAQKNSHAHKTSSGTPAGPEVWVEREQCGKTANAPLKAWSRFPLQLSDTSGPKAALTQVMPRAALEQTPGGSAQDEGGTQWWNIAVGDANGRTSLGWVCEKDHPDTEWQSPWSWPGFELVDSSSIAPVDMFKRFLFVTDQLFDGEAEAFSVVAASINKGELIGKLEKAVDLQGDGDGKVTAKELRAALKTRWLASALSHVAVRYESEWGGGMSKWDALSSLMGEGRYIWQGELERIQKLQWWEKVAGAVKGFPAEPVVWHLHPIGILGNFCNAERSSIDDLIRKIGDIIALGEGGYEAYNTGTNGPHGPVLHSFMHPPTGTVTRKTINEILATGNLSPENVNRLFATGKYQTILSTLSEGKIKLGLTGNEFYDADMQERFFRDFLINHAGGGRLASFIKKNHGSVDDALYAASMEWASIAAPEGRVIKDGRTSDGTMSYYEKKGQNHGNLQSTRKLVALLEQIARNRN
ncbi:hypothetical protein A9R05_24570 [Burkholderia sp. KK1]|nr:hypothetical protein A9R05_24570 [Burkholderia sp. KK1]